MCRTINAFLNTGIGGTIYCGVKDDGRIPGLNMSPYQVSDFYFVSFDQIQQIMNNHKFIY